MKEIVGDICDPEVLEKMRGAQKAAMVHKMTLHRTKQKLRLQHPEWRNATLKRKAAEIVKAKRG
jgi:hypothetical protein